MQIRAGRIAGGLGCALAFASAVQLHAAGQQSPIPTAAKPPVSNTGRPPGDAFLVDLSKNYDWRAQMPSHFNVDSEAMLLIFRRENVRFEKRGMRLAVEKNSGREMPYTMSEVQLPGFYGFGRYEVVMRSSNAPGVVSSFFTYTGEYHGDPHAEVDFEFLGKTPRQVHINFFNRERNEPVDVDLWFDASKGEHLYAFEWLPDSITWYVDGVKVHAVTAETSSIAIPTASSRVIANTWVGNRSTEEWVGTPTFERASAFYRCISHVPVGKAGKQCSDTFKPPKP